MHSNSSDRPQSHAARFGAAMHNAAPMEAERRVIVKTLAILEVARDDLAEKKAALEAEHAHIVAYPRSRSEVRRLIDVAVVTARREAEEVLRQQTLAAARGEVDSVAIDPCHLVALLQSEEVLARTLGRYLPHNRNPDGNETQGRGARAARLDPRR